MRRQSVREEVLISSEWAQARAEGRLALRLAMRRRGRGLPSFPHFSGHTVYCHPALSGSGEVEGGRRLSGSRHILLPTMSVASSSLPLCTPLLACLCSLTVSSLHCTLCVCLCLCGCCVLADCVTGELSPPANPLICPQFWYDWSPASCHPCCGQ